MAKRRPKIDMASIDRQQLVSVIEQREPEMIPVSKIKPNPYNKNKMGIEHYAALKANLANPEIGFTIPILVMPHPSEEGFYEIIDGEHRHRAAAEIGYEKIRCVVFPPLSPAKQKYLMVESNKIHGVTSDSDIKHLLQDIVEQGEEWAKELDVWAATVTEEPEVEVFDSPLDFDDEDSDQPEKMETRNVTLYFTEDQMQIWRDVTGALRRRLGITLEQAVVDIVNFYEQNEDKQAAEYED